MLIRFAIENCQDKWDLEAFLDFMIEEVGQCTVSVDIPDGIILFPEQEVVNGEFLVQAREAGL